MDKPGLFIWAHRGASGFAPENTMAAFQLAEQLGADGIELDVHLSADGIPVVMHDSTVDRTSNGRGRVGRLPLPRLRALDAGSWFHPRFAGEPIPTLEEVFRWIGNRLPLNVETKTGRAAAEVERLAERFPEVRVLLSSFTHSALEQSRQRAPELPRGFLTDSRFWRRPLQRAHRADAASFHPRQDRVSAELVTAAHQLGLTVFPYTVDALEQADRFARMGVDGIFTNRLFPQA